MIEMITILVVIMYGVELDGFGALLTVTQMVGQQAMIVLEVLKLLKISSR